MKENIHIHLDPMGGISGDMFISAMIDADSSFKKLAKTISKKIIKDIEISIKKSSIDHISGTKFAVKLISKAHNHHRSFNDIKKLIEKSYLDKKVKDISINIFNELAKAESQVHGVSIDKVSFHEIGAWDSIVDNIVAAAIINRLDTDYQVTWSCSPIPIGKGTIKTDHGLLSIPAPATSILLKNIPIIEDGIEGERTTPTG
ncbi:MAG: LarC family nickel insertion protein, partial [Pelagibacterales bacterium]|nr:LarC family nickel insertion protein [Pelagibacterales bacterium]